MLTGIQERRWDVASDWQRLDDVTAALAAATSWRMALDGVRTALQPDASLYQLSHRGRKLSGRDASDSFWLTHEPCLQQVIADHEVCLIPDGPAAGWWLPWQGGALRAHALDDEAPRWLLSIGRLLNAWPGQTAVDTPGDTLKSLHQLNELSWVIHQAAELDRLWQTVPEAIGRHLGASHCALIAYGDDDDIGRVVGGWEQGSTQPRWADLSFSRTSPLGHSLQRVPAGRWRPTPDAGPELGSGRAGQLFHDADTVLVPLVESGRQLGVLAVRHRHPRSPRLLKLLGALAEHVTAAWQLRRRHQLTAEDSSLAWTAFHGAPVALALLDGDGVLLWANGYAASLLGIEPDEAFPLYRFLTGKDRQRLTEAWLDLDGGRAVMIERATFHRADGTALDLGVRLNPLGPADSDRTGPRVVMTLYDRQASTLHQTELEHALHRWQSLGNALPQAIALVDAKHHLVWANAGHASVSGRDCCHPLFRDPEGGPCLASLALTLGVSRLVNQPLDGGLPQPTRTWPVHDEDGNVIGAVAMAMTTTLPQTSQDQERLTLLGYLVAPACHDLNGPLGVIHGRVEAMRLDGLESPHLAAIERAAERMESLLRQLGEWQGKGGEPTVLDLANELPAVHQRLHSALRALGLDWTIRLPDGPAHVWATAADLHCLLALLLLAPGKQRPAMALSLTVALTDGWIELSIDGWQPAEAWNGANLLAHLGGRSLPATERPRLTLQLPQWTHRTSVPSPM